MDSGRIHRQLQAVAALNLDTRINGSDHVSVLDGQIQMHLYLAIEDTDMIATVNPRIQVKGGDRLKLAMDPSRIHVFDKETEQVITN